MKSTKQNNSVLTEYDTESIYPNKKALSSSQVLLYEKNPADFYMKYELGVVPEKSLPMLIGSIFSELHQNRDFDYKTALREAGAPKHIPELFESVIAKFPVVPAEVALFVPYKGWKIRVTLDGFVEKHLIVIENKTGQTVWDQERVSFDEQLTIQNWAVWKLFGKVPSQTLLNWVNTKKNCRRTLTTLKTTRSVKNLQMFEKRLDLILENIEAGNWTNPIYG